MYSGALTRDTPALIVTTRATAVDSPTYSPDARTGAITTEPANTPRLTTWAIVACLIVYAVLRIALIPSAADVTKSFSHDSAYIAIVARNLLAGRGLVNDAAYRIAVSAERSADRFQAPGRDLDARQALEYMRDTLGELANHEYTPRPSTIPPQI